MDFISDGVARGHISSTLLQGAVAPAKLSNSANTRPKLDPPFGYKLRCTSLPDDSCPVQWQLAAQDLLFWRCRLEGRPVQKKLPKKMIDFDFLLL